MAESIRRLQPGMKQAKRPTYATFEGRQIKIKWYRVFDPSGKRMRLTPFVEHNDLVFLIKHIDKLVQHPPQTLVSQLENFITGVHPINYAQLGSKQEPPPKEELTDSFLQRLFASALSKVD